MIQMQTMVAIRFRWIWVEKIFLSIWIAELFCRNPLSLDMGWKAYNFHRIAPMLLVAIRFRWIWVEKAHLNLAMLNPARRNPLSLDMGWKVSSNLWLHCPPFLGRNPLSLDMGWKEKLPRIKPLLTTSQSAFAGYGLKSTKVAGCHYAKQ